MTKQYDIVIIGAGLIGLATALTLLKKSPGIRLAVVDKEKEVAYHQSGHNSGVIHSGIYYKPGSLKAKNCVRGVQLLTAFLEGKGIPYKKSGKVIVATSEEELPRLKELERRGKANGVRGLEMIDGDRLKEVEPAARGICALYSPNTGVVDYRQVAKGYHDAILEMGGEVYLSAEVYAIKKNTLVTSLGEFHSRFTYNCTGVYADRIAHLADPAIPSNQMVPFRGEFYEIVSEKRNGINGLIYPVPDPKFPFLGVHISKGIDGKVEAGPNAVLALSREGYQWGNVSVKDLAGYLSFPGFWKMAGRYWKMGAYEMYRSLRKKAFLKALQRLMPSLQMKDIASAGSGVRSQVVKSDGTMEDDFCICRTPGMVHVLNAPSPAATASLAIGEYLADLRE